MPLPWKKSKSSRISRFVTDLQQSPKHGGSLVVETGFPTSLIDLFVKNRDRLKKASSKRIHKPPTPQIQASPSRRRIEASSPPIPPLSLARYRSLPLNLDTAVVLDDPSLVNKIEETLIPPENINDDNNGGGETLNSDGNRGGGCVLMVAVFKVFMVAVLALSAKKLAVGITISAFALLFLELAVTRVFTYFNLCPNAHVRIDSLIEKLIGNRNTEKKEEEEKEEESMLTHERRNKVSFEIIEEPKEEEIRIISQLEKILSLEKTRSLDVEEKKEVGIIRYEKSKSARLKSKIVKKIVPKKLRSYKKKKKMKKMKQKEEGEEEIEVEIEEEEEEESMTEVSSLFSEERNESEISERDDVGLNPPLLEGCGEIEEEEEIGTKGDVMKVMSLIVIVLVGLLCGKVFAIGLTLSWCLILRSFCCKSQTQTSL